MYFILDCFELNPKFPLLTKQKDDYVEALEFKNINEQFLNRFEHGNDEDIIPIKDLKEIAKDLSINVDTYKLLLIKKGYIEGRNSKLRFFKNIKFKNDNDS